MFVLKRDGKQEKVQFDKITARINKLCYGLDRNFVDSTEVAQKVITGVYQGVNTVELDNLAAETAAYLTAKHPDYAILAARIAVSNLHKETRKQFSLVVEDLYNYVNPKTGKPASMISDQTYRIVKTNADRLDSAIIYDRDYNYNYFGFKTLERSYLLRIDGRVAERPSHMLMRVAVGIHGEDIDSAIETYHLMSQKYFTHASPTLFNAGTPRPQYASCFLIAMKEDSIEGIYDTLKECASISKMAGGIGLNVHNIRASGSYIAGTNGQSNGLVPMLRVFNNTARYVDQCFAPETFVFTDSGPKKIQDIRVCDSLLNSKGEFDEVEQLLHHQYCGKMLEFKINNSVFGPVKVTDLHQLLVVKHSEGQTHEHLTQGYVRPTMMNAKDVMIGDFVCFPIPKESTVRDKNTLSHDDLRFYGQLVVKGALGEQASYLGIKATSRNQDVHLFISKYLNDRGIIFISEQVNDHIIYSWSTIAINFKFRKSQICVDRNGQSVNIIDAKFLNLPKSKLLAIIQGIFDVAGNPNNGTLENLSLSVMSSLSWMLLRCGIISFKGQKDVLTVNTKCLKQIFDTSCPKIHIDTNDELSQVSHDGYLYSRVEEIVESDYEGIVYDLEISGDHTYVTSMGICHNGGNKRPGAFAVYLEPWHADIFEFLDLRKNHGKEEIRARDLFYALWIPDLFMTRVEQNGTWSLMCPHECPGLDDCWGEEFEKLYISYENKRKFMRQVPAQKLWYAILESQTETGNPFMLYKDACNRKSNQQHLGTIKCSNLCTEIVEYTSPDEVAVCTLSSLALPTYVIDKNTYDFQKLHDVVKVVTKNLNKIIDINYYPVPEAERSNMKHRPIGLGVQGLADAFIKMRLPFESEGARVLNQQIFETIYHAALEASCELAKEFGPYETYQGSPISKGQLQFDMWNVKPTDLWQWDELRTKIQSFGVRNSLLVAPMPTASTSQILGFNEAFEPYTSNIYVRRVLSGEFQVVNPHLLRDLTNLKLWNDDMKNKLIGNNGSVQNIDGIPEDLKALYKTVWEISQKKIIDLAADRGAFICQSQSLNIHMNDANYGRLTSMHFYGWKKGLKTGMYYLRTKAAVNAIQFTVDRSALEKKEKENGEVNQAAVSCSLENRDECLMCSG